MSEIQVEPKVEQKMYSNVCYNCRKEFLTPDIWDTYCSKQCLEQFYSDPDAEREKAKTGKRRNKKLTKHKK